MNSIESELTETIISDTLKQTSDANTIKKYSHNDKKQLVKRMGDIKNKKCYIKIFKLVHHGQTKYTVNDNGVLFNLTVLPDNLLVSIESIIQHYENKKLQFESDLKNSLNTPSYYNDTTDDINSDIIGENQEKTINQEKIINQEKTINQENEEKTINQENQEQSLIRRKKDLITEIYEEEDIIEYTGSDLKNANKDLTNYSQI